MLGRWWPPHPEISVQSPRQSTQTQNRQAKEGLCSPPDHCTERQPPQTWYYSWAMARARVYMPVMELTMLQVLWPAWWSSLTCVPRVVHLSYPALQKSLLHWPCDTQLARGQVGLPCRVCYPQAVTAALSLDPRAHFMVDCRPLVVPLTCYRFLLTVPLLIAVHKKRDSLAQVN